MNTKKILLNRVLPILLCVTLILSFSVHSSLASSIPSGTYNLDDLLSSFGVGSLDSALSFVESHYEDFPFVVLFSDSWNASNVMIYMFSDEVHYNPGIDTLYGDGVDYHLLYLDSSSSIYPFYYSTNNFAQSLYNHSFGSMYFNFDMLSVNGTDIYRLDPNLVTGFEPDSRTLEVVPVTLYESDYLRLWADVNLNDSSSFVTVSYTDLDGSYTYTFEPYQYVDVSYSSDYVRFYLNLSSIPTRGPFTITGVSLVTATTWGEKFISTNFSYDGSSIDLPSNYTDITYFTQYYVSQNDSSIGAAFLGNLYFGVYDNGSSFFLRDSDNFLVQNFDVKFIALPDFLWNTNGSDTANWALEEYYELFEMYDVVILGLPSTAFDELYGVGLYASIYINGWTVSSVINKIEKFTPEYHSTPLNLFNSNSSDFDWSNYYSNIGFIVTRNYLLKKTFYALGDVDSRLLDFESKLLSENGTLSSLENKFVTALTQDNTFYNSVVDSLNGFTSFINNLLLSDWFNKVLDYLKSISESFGEDSPIDIGDLESPLLDIYQFIDALYQGSKTKISDLRLTLKAVSSGILPDGNGGELYLLPSGTPTPVPLPTIPVLPALP